MPGLAQAEAESRIQGGGDPCRGHPEEAEPIREGEGIAVTSLCSLLHRPLSSSIPWMLLST